MNGSFIYCFVRFIWPNLFSGMLLLWDKTADRIFGNSSSRTGINSEIYLSILRSDHLCTGAPKTLIKLSIFSQTVNVLRNSSGTCAFSVESSCSRSKFQPNAFTKLFFIQPPFLSAQARVLLLYLSQNGSLPRPQANFAQSGVDKSKHGIHFLKHAVNSAREAARAQSAHLQPLIPHQRQSSETEKCVENVSAVSRPEMRGVSLVQHVHPIHNARIELAPVCNAAFFFILALQDPSR